MRKELYLAKYNRHLREIDFARNSFFQAFKLLVALWGAFIFYMTVQNTFLKARPDFAWNILLYTYFVFSLISMFLTRLIRIESIHYKIISILEGTLKKALRFENYEDRFRMRNTYNALYIAAASPFIALGFGKYFIAPSKEPFFILALKPYPTLEFLIQIITLTPGIIAILYFLFTLSYKPQLKSATKTKK